MNMFTNTKINNDNNINNRKNILNEKTKSNLQTNPHVKTLCPPPPFPLPLVPPTTNSFTVLTPPGKTFT